MKRSILMLLVMSAALISFGCEKMDPQPESVNDLETASLKGAKVKRTFTGTCTNVLTNDEVNEWYDAMDDWRVTGTTLWVQPDPTVFEGTCTLIVDARNPHEENSGKWEMTWVGTMTPAVVGFDIIAQAKGTGVEGKVKGMEAEWTYTMNWNPADPETFVYAVEGSIEKPQGPIKKD